MKKVILYIEDDPINALVMERFVHKHFEIHHKLDGDSGLHAISQNKFDIVLMDINLGKGKMDGIETMNKIKLIPGYENIPVIAVTSYAMPDDEARFKSLGFDDYLSKPVDRLMLLERIEILLNR